MKVQLTISFGLQLAHKTDAAAVRCVRGWPTAKPTLCVAGGTPVVDPCAVLDHLVLSSLLQRGAAGPAAAASAAAASAGRPLGTCGTMCNPASDSQLPLHFALTLGLTMLDALPSPVHQQQQLLQRWRSDPAASGAERTNTDGVPGKAAVQPFTWRADEMLLAVCRLLDVRPAVYSAAEGVTAAALQLAERLACLLAAAPGTVASQRVTQAATTLTWRTRLAIAPLLVAAAQLSAGNGSSANGPDAASDTLWSNRAGETTAARPAPLLTPPALRALPGEFEGRGNVADAIARHSLRLADYAARGSAMSGGSTSLHSNLSHAANCTHAKT